MPGRLSYAMSSTRTNWKTLLRSLQYSSTHWGPSMPSGHGRRRSVCQLPLVGGAGYPTSAALISEPSAFFPVAMFFGTLMKCPLTSVPDPGATS